MTVISISVTAFALWAFCGCAISNAARKTGDTSLINSAEVIVVAEILSVDTRRTMSDGPVIANVRVLKTLKGDEKENSNLTFGQSAWVGWTSFAEQGARLLFLQKAQKTTIADWPDFFAVRPKTCVQNLSVQDFIVERDSVPNLSLAEVERFLENPKTYKGPIRLAQHILDAVETSTAIKRWKEGEHRPEDFVWIVERALPKGTSQQRVLQFLGKPLSESSLVNGETSWLYIKNDAEKKQFEALSIIFDKDGKVTGLGRKPIR